MADKLAQLRTMLADHTFHHATVRTTSGLWNGLWIYEKAADGFQGFKPAFAFYNEDGDYGLAYELVRHTGVSVGARGQG